MCGAACVYIMLPQQRKEKHDPTPLSLPIVENRFGNAILMTTYGDSISYMAEIVNIFGLSI
jgi:hypothetical protein